MKAITTKQRETTIPLTFDKLKDLEAVTNSLDAIVLLMEAGNDLEVGFGLVAGMLRPLMRQLGELNDSLSYEFEAAHRKEGAA